jgi:hypothetical protein
MSRCLWTNVIQGEPAVRTVALVGFSPLTKHFAHDLPEETEIWSLNWAWKHALPRIDRLFEIHDDAYLAQPNAASRHHLDWLQEAHDFPIFMLPEARADVPSSVRYPFDENVDEFMGGLKRREKVQRVFTSTLTT